MEELYNLLNKEKSSVFSVPTFPTRRWGQIHLKFSTTDKKAIESAIKSPRAGKFYKIEIKNESI